MFSDPSEFQSLFEKGISILDWFFVFLCDTDGILPFEIDQTYHAALQTDFQYSHVYPGADKRCSYFAIAFLSGLKQQSNPRLIMPFEYLNSRGRYKNELLSEEFSERTTEAFNELCLREHELYINEEKKRTHGPGLIAEMLFTFGPKKTRNWAEQAFEHMKKYFVEASGKLTGPPNNIHIAAFSYSWLPILAAWHVIQRKNKDLNAESQEPGKLKGFRFLHHPDKKIEFAGEILFSGK